LGRLGRVWREADEEATNFETIVTDLVDGQYSNPVGIFCFNSAEGWSRDVSEDIAQEARRLQDLERRVLAELGHSPFQTRPFSLE
jgi:hypothetical protein